MLLTTPIETSVDKDPKHVVADDAILPGDTVRYWVNKFRHSEGELGWEGREERTGTVVSVGKRRVQYLVVSSPRGKRTREVYMRDVISVEGVRGKIGRKLLFSAEEGA